MGTLGAGIRSRVGMPARGSSDHVGDPGPDGGVGRTTRVLVVIAALVVGTVGIVPPAGANHETWGFSGRPGSVPPGGEIRSSGLLRQSDWDTPYDEATDAFQPGQAQAEECGDSRRVSLLDPTGRTVAVHVAEPHPLDPTVLVYPPFRVPDDARPGTYSLRQECTVGGHPISVCIEFRVTGPGSAPGPFSSVRRGQPLLRDACPSTLAVVVDEAMIRVRGIVNDLFARVLRGEVTGVPGAVPPTTTSTTRPAPGSSEGSGGSGGSGPTGDTVAPTVTNIVVSPLDACNSITVSASATDDVGIASIIVSWRYEGVIHGGIPMSSSGGASYSRNIGALGGNGGQLEIEVDAEDAAGNRAAGFATVEVGLC